jgi:flagellin
MKKACNQAGGEGIFRRESRREFFMVINHNTSALNTLNKLTANTTATTSSLEKLSSGLRINKAADDAAGLAISEKMKAQISGLDTASENAQNGISLIQTAEGALSESQSILQRMNELAVQAANGTNTKNDAQKLQDEVATLTDTLDKISTQTSYNTLEVLSSAGTGSLFDGGITLQVGAKAGETITVAFDGETFTGVDSSALGVNAVNLVSGASAAITSITDAIDKVSSMRSKLGAYQNSLTHTINNLGVESENLTSAESQITDVDMAKEMTTYTKNNILVQSAEAMLAQANQLPQGVLSLLK